MKISTSVSKASVIEDIWKNFYDRIKAQVTTTTITGSVVVPVQNWVSSFPDQLIDSKSDYPIVVVENPKFDNESFTMTKGTYKGKIGIEVYTNQGESADKFLSQIMEAIETYKYQLKLVGISMVELDGTDSDKVSRDKIKVHTRRALFKFKFNYSKTIAY